MTAQPYFDEIQVGDELPLLVKRPSTKELVMYAGASGDFYQIHYDLKFAKAEGLPGVIIHGALKNAYLGQLVTDWMGDEGVLRQLSIRYRGMDVPGDTLTCRGRVTEKTDNGGEHLVRCDLSLENGKGEKTTTGEAVVSLPVKP